MEIRSALAERGVVEQRFDLDVGGEAVPGIMWSPEGAGEPRPTILLGHGGTQHKRTPYVLGMARRFVRHLGYVAVAVDAPEHGDRVTDPARTARRRQALEERIAAGRDGGAGRHTFGAEEAAEWVARTERGGAEWRALLDDLEASHVGGTYGYLGLSMGTAIGLPFVASEPRIAAAVLGLAGLGHRPGAEDFEAAARRLAIPILFLFQWHDELVTREAGLALFGAIASAEKTMHVNPGGHVGMPAFESDACEAFFVRHLGPALPHG